MRALLVVLVIAGIAWYVLTRGTSAIVTDVTSTVAEREAKYAPTIVSKYLDAGLPPEYGLATALVESDFNPDAINRTDPGGAFGMFQELGSNARIAGFGDGTNLFDFDTALRANVAFVKPLDSATGGDIAEMASRYNSGKPLADAPLTTRTIYVPAVVAAAQSYGERLRAGEFYGA